MSFQVCGEIFILAVHPIPVAVHGRIPVVVGEDTNHGYLLLVVGVLTDHHAMSTANVMEVNLAQSFYFYIPEINRRPRMFSLEPYLSTQRKGSHGIG